MPPKNVIGKSTIESIQSGAVYGFSGQVDALVERFQAELGECTVVATGGLAELIMPFSRTIQHHEPWLTLHGLRIVFERNQLTRTQQDERDAAALAKLDALRAAGVDPYPVRFDRTLTLGELRGRYDGRLAAGKETRRRRVASPDGSC